MARKHARRNDGGQGTLVLLHVGDLHLTGADAPSARDLRAILDQLGQLPRHVYDFVYLPGDLAEDGTTAQYDILRDALRAHPSMPIRLIPGDHDKQHGDIEDFERVFIEIAGSKRGGGHAPIENRLPQPEDKQPVHQYYYGEMHAGVKCLFLDVISAGFGRKGIGLDFRLGAGQTQWLSSELAAAAESKTPCAVFMHGYPDDLREPYDRLDIAGLFWSTRVRLVEMGHTHYNELAHDGRTLYATARSVGQNEDGSAGYAVAAIDGPVTSWRFRALDRTWPFVMITSPADRRVAMQPLGRVAAGMELDGKGRVTVRALVLSDQPPDYCRCRVDTGPWVLMELTESRCYEARLPWPEDGRSIQVEAVDRRWPGHGPDYVDTDVIEPVIGFPDPPLPSCPMPSKPGSDAFALGPWLQKGVRGDQLGPNKNGRKW
ncbi:metallophosphoesterase family protein [Methylobacterium thuringiense]|uniref:3',5'-cyclic adenosine monophosphate phosphodiesterase CpdA n=1 Tax=Methylobacterium thuringiense TaxID=1003091 RepID=A0ABQ4TJN7_9HYPH|nr:metallophosphoesterase [Methylobacterium thuringiense]GJE55017.1 3',5'-cyclic adenosine monophosphate phosphodiesterase CpdA [Methylobacterium thuringiense]